MHLASASEPCCKMSECARFPLSKLRKTAAWSNERRRPPRSIMRKNAPLWWICARAFGNGSRNIIPYALWVGWLAGRVAGDTPNRQPRRPKSKATLSGAIDWSAPMDRPALPFSLSAHTCHNCLPWWMCVCCSGRAIWASLVWTVFNYQCRMSKTILFTIFSILPSWQPCVASLTSPLAHSSGGRTNLCYYVIYYIGCASV